MAVLFVEYLERREARASTSASTGASPTCASRSPGPSPGPSPGLSPGASPGPGSGISSVWKEMEKVMKEKLGVKQSWQGCQESVGVGGGMKEEGKKGVEKEAEKGVGVGVGVKDEGVEKGVGKDKFKGKHQEPGEMLTMGEEAELLAMELRMALASDEVITSTHIHIHIHYF